MTQNFSRLHVTLGPPSTLQENLDSDSWGIDHRSPSRWASGHSPNTAQDSSCWDPRMSGTSSRKRSRCPGASTDGTQGRLCSQTRLEHAEGSQVSSEGLQPRATMPPEENQPPGHWPPCLGTERPDAVGAAVTAGSVNPPAGTDQSSDCAKGDQLTEVHIADGRVSIQGGCRPQPSTTPDALGPGLLPPACT